MSKFRNLSPVEYSYLARDTGNESPFVNQFFVEGKGDISIEQMQGAVELAAQKNPGISLRLKGRWAWRYWEKNETPPLVLEYRGVWQANHSSGAEVIDAPLDARKDVLSSITLFKNITAVDNSNVNFKILFRIHHAVCDGMGTLHWIKEVFRALRNEPLLGSQHQLSELDIIRREDYPKVEALAFQCNPVFPKSLHPEKTGCHWLRCHWEISDSKIIAKLIFSLKEICVEQHGAGKMVFRIPADLRRYLNKEEKQQAHLSNLSGVFDIQLDADDDVNEIQNRIIKALRNKQDLSVYPKHFISLTKFLPKTLFRPKVQAVKAMLEKGHCNITAMISAMMRQNLDEFSCASFNAYSVFAIPMPLEDKSIYIGLITNRNGLNLILSIPNALADEQQSLALAKRIENRLKNL